MEKVNYGELSNFLLFRFYDFLTYNIWFMRHNFSHGRFGDMTKEDFAKLDEKNINAVEPCYEEALKRTGNEDNFKEWYSYNSGFVKELTEKENEELLRCERKYKDSKDESFLKDFLQRKNYKDMDENKN